MSTTPQYELLRSQITEDDPLKAFDFLLKHIGFDNRAAIADIAFHLYQSRGENAIRKARDVVEILRTIYYVPVCSSSGVAGRWLAANYGELQECLNDFIARHTATGEVISALRKAIVPPAQITRHATATQASLL